MIPLIRLLRRGDQIFHSFQPSGFKETENDDDHHQHGPSQYQQRPHGMASMSAPQINSGGRVAVPKIKLVPRHGDYDWLIPSQFRMGRSLGATRIWMLRATPG